MRSDDFIAREQELEHCCQLRDDRIIRLIVVVFIAILLRLLTDPVRYRRCHERVRLYLAFKSL